jgi:hypothetical protein
MNQRNVKRLNFAYFAPNISRREISQARETIVQEFSWLFVSSAGHSAMLTVMPSAPTATV